MHVWTLKNNFAKLQASQSSLHRRHLSPQAGGRSLERKSEKISKKIDTGKKHFYLEKPKLVRKHDFSSLISQVISGSCFSSHGKKRTFRPFENSPFVFLHEIWKSAVAQRLKPEKDPAGKAKEARLDFKDHVFGK